MFDISATLVVNPKLNTPTNPILQITRGATATLTFDLSGKAYMFNNIDQITFILKQGQTTYWYKMFTYLQPTQDNVPLPGKIYYENVSRNSDSFKCQADQVLNPQESPVDQHYYEEIDGSSNWRNTKFVFDPHFYYTELTDLQYITLVLSDRDTLNFRAKQNIKFEVALRLDTEKLEGYNKQDSIIIEPQNDIIVVDSLYSNILD